MVGQNFAILMNNDAFLLQQKLSRLYKGMLLKLTEIIVTQFSIQIEDALRIADNIANKSIKGFLKFEHVEKNRIIQYTGGAYYIKISALKLRQLENTIKELKEMGLAVEDGLVCKLYLPTQKEPVLILQGRKKSIVGRDFWMFNVRKKYYMQLKDYKFTVVIQPADKRVQRMGRILKKFNRLVKNITKNMNPPQVKRVKAEVSLIDLILQDTEVLEQQLLKNTKPVLVPKKGKEQVKEVVMKKVKQVEQTVEATKQSTEQEKIEISYIEQERREQVEREYYEKLRKELDNFIDWLTVKRLKEDYGIEHIKSFAEFKEAVENNELINGAEKLIKDIPMVRSHVRRFIEFLERDNYKIDKNSIFKFFNSLEKELLTKDTLSRYKSHLKQFINYLGDYENYIFISNIKTKGRRGKKGQGFFYNPEQIETILKQIVGHQKLSEKEKDELIGLISLMYITGLRYSEAMRLQVRDFNFENRIGIVRRTKAKKNYARPIFITEQVRDYLVSLIKKYNKKPNDLLFDRSIRFFRQPHKVRITEELRKIGIELNVSGLRDSYATLKEHYRYKVEVIHDLESLIAGHSAKIRDRHYNQIKTRFEEIFDNRELYSEEYEFVKWLRDADDVIMRQALKNVKIPPV